MKSNDCSDVVRLPPKPPLPRIPPNVHSSGRQGDKAAVSPRQNREQGKVKAETSKCLLSDDDEDTTAASDRPTFDFGKPSGMVPCVDFALLRELRKSESSESDGGDGGNAMTSPNENTNSADVIYDEPFAEFESRSLKSMIRSDGYIRLRADVIEATELLRKKAARKQHRRKSHLRVLGDDLSKTPPSPPRSRSSESLDVLLDGTGSSSFDDDDDDDRGAAALNVVHSLRSSFVDPNGPPTRRSVYLDLGDYQTLLKHSRNDAERVYSLPQPQCYGEETLRAVRRITQKYDTFKRRQLRDLSFRDGAGSARWSRDEGRPTSRVAPAEGSSTAPSGKESSPDAPVSGGVEAVHRGSAETEVDGVRPDVEESRSKDLEENKTSSSQSRKSDWSSLRDYCNTLHEETANPDVDDVIESGLLSRSSLIRIELFYRSRESAVYVARCLADLFVGTAGGPGSPDAACPPMVHQHTGVPVWILNSGLGIRRRELVLVLAERETGLPLWSDRISYLSDYHAPTPTVHRLRLSGSLQKTVRLEMSCERSGEEFLATFRQMASDPHDDLWKVSADDNRKSTKRTGSRRKKRQKLSKLSISQPCNFVRVSCLDPSDANFRAAFSGLVPLANRMSTTATEEDFSTACDTVEQDKAYRVADSTQCEFRPRLPTR